MLKMANRRLDCLIIVNPELNQKLRYLLRQHLREKLLTSRFASCIDWVAPVFEIVDSVYPEWKFAIPDAIAAGGLHGQLIIGQKVSKIDDITQKLVDQKVTLLCDSKVVEEGCGSKLCWMGQISALKHLFDGISEEPFEGAIKSR